MMRKIICALMIGGMLIFGVACQRSGIPMEETMTQADMQDPVYNGTYKVVAQACDWGPASAKVIVELDETISASDLCSFRVTESNASGLVGEREITAVYLCDESGSEAQGSSPHIAIEMSVNPSHGALLYYDFSRYLNIWDDQYSLKIEPIDPESDVLKNLSVNPLYTARLLPEADVFKNAEFSYQETTMKYALYAPAADGLKKPIVIWLHGQGEGGSDVTVTLYGNKVTALVSAEIQEMMGGAYVLVPQCPTYWPENSPDNRNFGMRADGTSCFEEPLLALIDDILASNSDIDRDRVYIGGCSMGGYMTMLMVKNNPDYFVAAFPVCEVYNDALITDENIGEMARMPLWLIYCTADQTVPPRQNSAATIDRLKNAGAENLHASVFPDVHDTTGDYLSEDGTPYTYDAHWVWIYMFNNECDDGDLNLWEWLASQHR